MFIMDKSIKFFRLSVEAFCAYQFFVLIKNMHFVRKGFKWTVVLFKSS